MPRHEVAGDYTEKVYKRQVSAEARNSFEVHIEVARGRGIESNSSSERDESHPRLSCDEENERENKKTTALRVVFAVLLVHQLRREPRHIVPTL